MDIENPFPNSEASVHLWQGAEDLLVPVKLQRYIAQRLTWIHYLELAGSGHLFGYIDGLLEHIIKVMLFGEWNFPVQKTVTNFCYLSVV